MAAGAWKIYAKAKRYIGNGTIILGSTGKFYMMLLRKSASGTIAALSTTSIWSQISASEINAAGGYAANGRLIGSTSKWMGFWTVGITTKQMKWTYSTGGLVFTASGASLVNIKYAAIRYTAAAAANGKLLCFCTLSATAFSIVNPNTLTITPNSNGVFTLA